jgi:hypothetical protein
VKKALLILFLCCFVTLRSEASVWYGINYDAKTVAAMVAAYGTETATEKYYSEQVQKILDRYSAAEVASAGIFMSKYLDRKAMTELGVWSSRTENYLPSGRRCREDQGISSEVLNNLLSDDLVVKKGDDCICVKLMSKPLKRAHHGRVLADKQQIRNLSCILS